MLAVYKKIFSRPKYILVVIVVATVTTVATLLLPNRGILGQMMTSDYISATDKFLFVMGLLGSLATNFTWLSATYLIVVSLVLGTNIALLIFYIRRRQINSKGNAKSNLAGVAGTVSAILGIGCASCGSIIIMAVLGIAGGGSLVALLPLHGYEFGIVGLSLLFYSIYYLTKRINDPLVCRLD